MSEKVQRIIRKKDLPQFVGLGVTQIDELMKTGEFPKPIPLSDHGRAIGWLESELAEWQQARLAARADADAVERRLRRVTPKTGGE